MSAERILYSESEISRRVAEIARAIAGAPLRPEVATPILAGAFVFAADLMRALAREGLDLAAEFLWLRSYGRGDRAGEVEVLKAPDATMIRGRIILLIDGVMETGATLARARDILIEAGAARILSAVAVQKPCAAPAFTPDHVGFTAGAEFLYGYGMDRAGAGRGIPDIRIRKKNS